MLKMQWSGASRATTVLGITALGCSLWASCSERERHISDDDDDGTTTTVASSSSGGSVGGTGGAGVGSASSTSSTTGSTSTTGGTGGSGDMCLMGACAPKDPSCTSVPSCCIALEDNQFKPKFTLRIGQITFAQPMVFATGLVGNTLANSLQMNLGQCNLQGSGTFSWLLEYDTNTQVLKTGGAKPAADPSVGYCFVDEMVSGLQISPVSVNASLSVGQLSANVGDLIMPMYLDSMGTSSILPLHQVGLSGTLSPDNNCIGKYNSDTLDPANNCLADPPNTLTFTNAGTIDGYITLEDADAVIIDSLSQSLCVLLSGDPVLYGDGMSPTKCKRDAMQEIVYHGDWCASTNMAATAACYDSARFKGDFAASAVQALGNCP
jgi:hypothetical protein